ncbi:ATP-binding cassette domain-containing protein [Verrucomicrobium spinosum]|uniref:ATP-binding cassette domain-containing protein n=1 Tax=Verrucomicrobium spinosum TaxID=2736 RepID=UPI000B07E8D1|nr:ATP-binding cassette domain-containing protein [Verrucomicrobium spinosum]
MNSSASLGNGAGKTTVFNLITGVYQHGRQHQVRRGLRARHKPHQITKLGIARTFQNIRLFSSLSVFDNVRTAKMMHLQHGIAHSLFRGPAFLDEEAMIENEVFDLLDIFDLGKERPRRASRFATVISAAWRSSAPWPPSPSSCCWMSPPPG